MQFSIDRLQNEKNEIKKKEWKFFISRLNFKHERMRNW